MFPSAKGGRKSRRPYRPTKKRKRITTPANDRQAKGQSNRLPPAKGRNLFLHPWPRGPHFPNAIFRYLPGLEKVNICWPTVLASSSFPWLPDLLHVLLGPLQSLDKTAILLGRPLHDLRHIELQDLGQAVEGTGLAERGAGLPALDEPQRLAPDNGNVRRIGTAPARAPASGP